MRVEQDGTIVLSRRNLLALLHKLDMPGSQRTIIGRADGVAVIVRSEDDEVHYAHPSRVGEAPGEMHPATESFIAENLPQKKRTFNSVLGGLKL